MLRGWTGQAWRVTVAFLYGVLLGVMWECASMLVLVAAALVEHVAGTLVMAVCFVGLAACAFSVAARADLARPLLGIMAFRLSAQFAMTLGTGSVRFRQPCMLLGGGPRSMGVRPDPLDTHADALIVPLVCTSHVQLLLTTMLSDTPTCASERLRSSGWRAPLVALLKAVLPRRWLRRVVGVEPPYGPPFLRILAAVASREWLGWIPSMGLPSVLALPGTITFRPDRAAAARAAERSGALAASDAPSMLESLLPGTNSLAGVYTYACKDVKHGDFYYIFRYQAFWMRPASAALLQSVGSLLLKMLLMHAYASLFMLLSQGTCREAFVAELTRRRDRIQRWLYPRPPVRRIPIEPGDLCAFCHEELLRPPPDEADDDESASDGPSIGHWGLSWQRRGGSGEASSRGSSEGNDEGQAPAGEMPLPADLDRFVLHCRWGCGKAVHKSCAAAWGRNACVYCSAPMS